MMAAFCLTLSPGCTSGESAGDRVPAPTSGATTTSNGVRQPRDSAVDSLGLTFRLPWSFGSVPHPDFAFLARSYEPQSIFSIDHDSPDIVDHQPEGAESLTRSRISGHDAVTIRNAVVEGLPPGVIANELLVANGSRSFSVIMSARARDLSPLWNEFIRSVRIDSG